MAPFQNTEQHYVIVYQPYLTLRFSLNFKHELMYFLTCDRKQITMVNLKASVPTSYPC